MSLRFRPSLNCLEERDTPSVPGPTDPGGTPTTPPTVPPTTPPTEPPPTVPPVDPYGVIPPPIVVTP